MDEIFILIDGYPNYAVSNLGRVKSLGNNKTKKEKILSCGVDGGGYPIVVLHKNCKPKTFRIHKLVAQAFIPNPENKPRVDHINTIRTDNRVENLRWCTQKENCNNEISRENYSKAKKGNQNVKGKHWKLDPLTGKRVYS